MGSHGTVIAGWPVTLNVCVRRSSVLRTVSSQSPMRTVAAPTGCAGTGSVGSSSASTPSNGAVHLADQHAAAAAGAQVVLGQDVACGFQADPDGRQVVAGPRFDRARVVLGGLGQRQRHVDRGRVGRVGNRHGFQPDARLRQPAAGALERRGHAGVQVVEEVGARNAEAQPADGRRRAGRRLRAAQHVAAADARRPRSGTAAPRDRRWDSAARRRPSAPRRSTASVRRCRTRPPESGWSRRCRCLSMPTPSRWLPTRQTRRTTRPRRASRLADATRARRPSRRWSGRARTRGGSSCRR